MRKLWVALVVVLGLFGSRPVHAATAFDRAFPEETLLYFQIKDLPGLGEKIKTHAIYHLWQEDAVQKFLEGPLERLREEIAKAEGDADVKLSEIGDLFKGDVAFGLRADFQAEEVEFVLLIDVGAESERAMAIVGKLVTGPQEQPKNKVTIVEETYEGVSLMQVKEPGRRTMFTYGVSKNVFILGLPHEAVKRTVSFLKNPPAQSLASSPLYKTMLNKVSAKSDVVFYFNAAHLFSELKQQEAQGRAGAVLDALGMSDISAMVAGYELGSEFDTSRMFIKAGQPPKGILKMIRVPPGPLHTGADVPPDVSTFFTLRTDPPTVWDEVERILAVLNPRAFAAMNESVNRVSQQTGQPISVRNDIMAALGQRFSLYTRYEKPFDALTSKQQVFMIDITGKAAFEQALEKLRIIVPQLAVIFQPEDYMGYRLYVFGMPTRPGVPQPQMAGVRPAYVVTENQLVFSASDGALKAHLRRIAAGGPSLKDDPNFQSAVKLLPTEGRIMLGYSNPKPEVEAILESLRSGQLAMVLNMLRMDPDVGAFLDLFDMELLPESEVITKHLVPSAGCMMVQPDGLMIFSKSPARPR